MHRVAEEMKRITFSEACKLHIPLGSALLVRGTS
jgi:hypothetical protein